MVTHREPNPDEARIQAMSVIAACAKGLMYFQSEVSENGKKCFQTVTVRVPSPPPPHNYIFMNVLVCTYARQVSIWK